MSDVFREVDEDLRRERLKRFWQRYGKFLIGAAVLVVVAVAVSVYLQSARTQRAEADGNRYYEGLRLVEAGDLDGARTAFQSLREDGGEGYPLLAEFQLAGISAKAGDPAAAAAAFDAIAADTAVDQPIRDVAQIRAAMTLLDTAPLQEIQRRMEPFNVEFSPYRYLAIELMTVSAINAGDYQTAYNYLSTIQASEDMSQAQLARLQQLFATIIGHEDLLALNGIELPGAPAAPAPSIFDLRAGGTPPATVAPAPTPAAPAGMDLRANPAATPIAPAPAAPLAPAPVELAPPPAP